MNLHHGLSAIYHDLLVSNPDLPSRAATMDNAKPFANGIIAVFSQKEESLPPAPEKRENVSDTLHEDCTSPSTTAYAKQVLDCGPTPNKTGVRGDGILVS